VTAEPLDQITLPPFWEAHDGYPDNDPITHLQLAYPQIIDVRDPSKTFPGGIELEFPRRLLLDELALDVITALTISGLHEALEFVTSAGKRLASPHANGVEWAWLVEHVGQLVRDYQREFPA
jgi:hypothetical protein